MSFLTLIIFVMPLIAVSTQIIVPDLRIPPCAYKCPSNKSPYPNPNHQKTSNGCGSKGIFVDASLLPKPEMEKCCNEHDFCYDTCNSGKRSCDVVFRSCLLDVCNTTMDRKAMICNKTAELFYSVVRDLGCMSYIDAQKNTCLCQ